MGKPNGPTLTDVSDYGDEVRPTLLHFGNNLSYNFVAATISIYQQQQQFSYNHGFGDVHVDDYGTYDEIT